jgi:hypothetical protein
MLSPNARKRVHVSVGVRVTTTGKLQVAVWDAASVAVQETAVSPMGNVLPDPGVHWTVAGARPPCVDTWKETAAPAGSTDPASTSGGHIRPSGSGLGPVDEPPQAAVHSAI